MNFMLSWIFFFCSRPLVAQCSFLLQCLRAAQSISMSKYVVNDWEHEYLGSMTLNTASILNTRSDLLFVYFVYSVFMAVMSPSLHFTHLHLLFVAGCFFPSTSLTFAHSLWSRLCLKVKNVQLFCCSQWVQSRAANRTKDYRLLLSERLNLLSLDLWPYPQKTARIFNFRIFPIFSET